MQFTTSQAIPLYPKTQRERKARNLATVCSFQKGSIPYARKMGVDYPLDSPSTTGSKSAVIAVMEAANSVSACSIKSVTPIITADGMAAFQIIVGD